MSASTKTNLFLDLTIFSAFLVVSNPRLTGNSIHEWLGISMIAGLVTHLLFHWQWLVKVSTEFFKKLFHQSRLNFVVDALFFTSMTGAMLSGILISKDVLALLGLQFNAGGGWKAIHSLTADTSMLALGVHIALHWKWIVSNLGRYIAAPVANLFQRRSAPRSLAVQPVRIDENE